MFGRRRHGVWPSAAMWILLVIWLIGGFYLLVWAMASSMTFFGEIPTKGERAETTARWNLVLLLLLSYGLVVSIVAAVLGRRVWFGLYASSTVITAAGWFWIVSL